MRHFGSLLVDGTGRLQAANDTAQNYLGVDNFQGVYFKDLFNETDQVGKIQSGEATACNATLKSNSAEFSLRGVAMASHAGPIVQISIFGIGKPSSPALTAARPGVLMPRKSTVASSQPDTAEPADVVTRNLLKNQSLPANVPPLHFDLADYSPHGLLLLSGAFEFLAANVAFFEMTQLQRDDVQGRGWLAALPSDESQQLAGALAGADWANCESVEHECRLVSPLGKLLWVRWSGRRIAASGIGGAGNAHNFVLTLDDIDQRKQSDDQNQRLAHQDSLTGLPNRRSFENALTECILERCPIRSILAVLFIDLDGFKQVNDTYGHETGDQLLKKMANTISEASSRATMVSRLGGDEFTVLLTNVKRIEEVKHFASRLNVLLRDNLCIKGVSTEVSASIGIAMHHKLIEDRRSADRIVNDLLRHADDAMYAAKSSGKNCYMFYGSYANDAHRSRTLQSTDTLIREVYRAIKHDDIFVEYQPQMATETGEIISCEALIRWRHQREGLIGPASFVPLVESNGAMGELTIWLIRRICSDFRNSLCTYKQISGRGHHLSISVNLSPAQLQDREILETIDQIITSEALPTNRFLFEITERTLIADPVAGHDGVDWLRRRGYRVALDDFGTGYSSLAYLHRFPLDEIKLDGSFIRDVETSAASQTVANSVVELAHALGICVTAEGVEHESQLRYLSQIGCDHWQGYLMSPAISPNDFMALVRAKTKSANTSTSTNQTPKALANTGHHTASLTES